MPTYANPYSYTSPIGEALGKLGQVMMSGPSAAERIKGAEEALKLKTTREKTQSVADMFAAFGTPGFDRNSLVADSIVAGINPSVAADNERYLAANAFGAADPRTDNAFRGAGGAYSGTASAFATDQGNQNQRAANSLAESARQFDSTPYEYIDPTTKQPMVGTRSTSFGARPIMAESEVKGFRLDDNFGNLGALPPAEQRVLGADAATGTRTPRNYVAGGQTYITYDGVTDARTGQPLVPNGYLAGVEGSATDAGVTTATQTKLEGADISNQNLGKLIGYARQQIAASPDTNFGAAGTVKGYVQDATVLASNIAQGFGFSAPAEALAALQAKAVASGVDANILSGIYDPRLGQLNTTYSLLIYATASALAGQSGRDLSNADVQRAIATVGDPTSLFANKQQMLAKLATIEEIAALQQGTTDKALGRPVDPNAARFDNFGAPAGAVGPVGATGAAPEKWIRGPNGLQRAQ